MYCLRLVLLYYTFTIHLWTDSQTHSNVVLYFIYPHVFQLPPPVPKKTLRKSVTREKSLDLPDRQRQEARRRLMAAKRAASFRQNSASERADSIEIYIPEAQTRLWESQKTPSSHPHYSQWLNLLKMPHRSHQKFSKHYRIFFLFWSVFIFEHHFNGVNGFFTFFRKNLQHVKPVWVAIVS